MAVFERAEVVRAPQYKKEFFPQSKIEDLALSLSSAPPSDSLLLPSDNIASAMSKEGRWDIPGVRSNVTTHGQSSGGSGVLMVEQRCMKCEGFAFREVKLLLSFIS